MRAVVSSLPKIRSALFGVGMGIHHPTPTPAPAPAEAVTIKVCVLQAEAQFAAAPSVLPHHSA